MSSELEIYARQKLPTRMADYVSDLYRGDIFSVSTKRALPEVIDRLLVISVSDGRFKDYIDLVATYCELTTELTKLPESLASILGDAYLASFYADSSFYRDGVLADSSILYGKRIATMIADVMEALSGGRIPDLNPLIDVLA